jgi:uncharacterized protein YutE (UPF0331/DUF86 family)
MNNPLIAKKLESLIHCLKRIEEKRPRNLSDLQKDFDIQDIISINLERAIQLCVDIAAVIISERNLKTSNTMAGSFLVLEDNGILPEQLSLNLQKAVGFRNVSVHEYASIDWNIVFDVIHNHLGSFKEYLKIAASFA